MIFTSAIYMSSSVAAGGTFALALAAAEAHCRRIALAGITIVDSAGLKPSQAYYYVVDGPTSPINDIATYYDTAGLTWQGSGIYIVTWRAVDTLELDSFIAASAIRANPSPSPLNSGMRYAEVLEGGIYAVRESHNVVDFIDGLNVVVLLPEDGNSSTLFNMTYDNCKTSNSAATLIVTDNMSNSSDLLDPQGSDEVRIVTIFPHLINAAPAAIAIFSSPLGLDSPSSSTTGQRYNTLN